MCDAGVNILAISQRENINKGKGTEKSPEIEIDGNLAIYRPFDSLKKQKSILVNLLLYFKIKKAIKKFKPNVIFCEELGNMMLALKIKRDFKIPIVLRVEFAFEKNFPYRTMGRTLKFFKNRITGDYLSIFIGGAIWKLACKYSDAVISCYYGDFPGNNNLHYVPWPTSCPKIKGDSNRSSNRAVFIGSFDRHKNLGELEVTLPLLFQQTPLEEFWIVGLGEDADVVNRLKASFPNQIRHITSLTRGECLELIRDSFFSYSPAKRGGWGFIGDSWAMRTPVVVTHNHYEFHDGVDSIVTNPNKIVDRVNELYLDNQLFSKVSNGGYIRYAQNYTAESVGDKFHNICMSVLDKY